MDGGFRVPESRPGGLSTRRRRDRHGALYCGPMNVQSEIQYFSELTGIDKARFLTLLAYELAEEAKATYGPGVAQVADAAHLRFINEIQHRIGRFAYQILSDDSSRPGDDVLIRMLLSARLDKTAERFIASAYRRTLQSFDRHDTTVLLNQ